MPFIFSILLFTINLADAECPPEAMAVEHRSPVTGIKRSTCGYMQDGILIKHGPEIEFRADGSIKKTIYYNHNEEGKAPSPQPKFSKTNLPGAEEGSEAFGVVEKLLRVLTFKHSGLNDGEFQVGKCDPDSRQWVKAALTKSDLKKSYTFKEHCDVSGSFTASFRKEFPVKFQLRNLQDFTSTVMKVTMMINPAKSGIRYRFEVSDGSVSSKEKSIQFTAQYEVSLNPLTGKPLYSTQEGKITLVRVGNKDLNITRPLVFSE